MTTSKTVVVVGAGSHGIGSANHIKRELKDQCTVKLISISDNAYFLPAAIRLPLTREYENIIYPLTDVVDKDVEIIKDEVLSFTDSAVSTKSGKVIEFDALVLATGSRWSSPVASTFDFGDNHEKYFEEQHDKIESAKHILLIGGGFVNAELVGELVAKYEADIKSGSKKISIVHNADKLLPNGPFYGENLRSDITNWMKEHGVKLYLNSKGVVSPNDPHKVIINGKEEVEADLIYFGTGIKPIVPENDFVNLTNKQGFVRVDKTFQAKGVPKGNIFAIGDVNDFEYHGLIKREDWSKTIRKNVALYLKEGSKAKLTETSTFENENIPGIVSLGPKHGKGQLPLPLFGTVRAPDFLAVSMKSKTLFTEKVKKMTAR